MSAITTALEHVVTRLNQSPVKSAVQGRVYQGAAPADTSFPIVLIQTYGDSSDYLGVGRPSAGTSVELLVRVIAPADSLLALESIHGAAIAALHGTSGQNSRGFVASCVRVSESETAAVEETGVVRYLGSRYRLLVNEQLAS